MYKLAMFFIVLSKNWRCYSILNRSRSFQENNRHRWT